MGYLGHLRICYISVFVSVWMLLRNGSQYRQAEDKVLITEKDKGGAHM